MKITFITSIEGANYTHRLFPSENISIDTNSLDIFSFIINSKYIKINYNTKKSILKSNAVILLLDKTLNDIIDNNTQLYNLLKRLSNNMLLIPIIYDDCEPTTKLKNFNWNKCNLNSDDDYLFINKHIEDKLSSYPFETPKNTTKNFINKILALYSFVLWGSFASVFFATKYFGIEFSDYEIIFILLAIIGITIEIFKIIYGTVNDVRQEEVVLENYSQKLNNAVIIKTGNINGQASNQYYNCFEKNRFNSQNIASDSNPNYDDSKVIDAIKHMNINLENIKEFYIWSQKQAKYAFRLAIVLCILGALLIFFAILFPIVFNRDIDLTIIPAIGGAIVEVIAGTSLIVYQRSLSQLNHYHKALHEDERFLTSVNLLNRFSKTETQDEMLKEIIRSEIQMNIIESENRKHEQNVEETKKSKKN